MDGFLWVLTEVIALLVFVGALVKGRSFWSAVKMGVGVIILGIIAIIAVHILTGVAVLMMALLSALLWVALVFIGIVFVARLIRGAA